MSGRIAHRPRYRNTYQYMHASFNAQQKFFSKHWTYLRQKPALERRPLGYGLALIPTGYRSLRNLVHYRV